LAGYRDKRGGSRRCRNSDAFERRGIALALMTPVMP
jgi:hypothetical protein